MIRHNMKIAPLKSSFLAMSMFGFLISVIFIPTYSKTWAFTFGLIFTIMFIASMISMVNATPDEQFTVRPKKLH